MTDPVICDIIIRIRNRRNHTAPLKYTYIGGRYERCGIQSPDDELIARSTSEYFSILGIKTAYVTSYEAAVDFLDTHTISLLLLDINLGDRSGFDLCKRIRESYDMPILFISARTSDDDVIIALNIGGDDYIKKECCHRVQQI